MLGDAGVSGCGGGSGEAIEKVTHHGPRVFLISLLKLLLIFDTVLSVVNTFNIIIH